MCARCGCCSRYRGGTSGGGERDKGARVNATSCSQRRLWCWDGKQTTLCSHSQTPTYVPFRSVRGPPREGCGPSTHARSPRSVSEGGAFRRAPETVETVPNLATAGKLQCKRLRQGRGKGAPRAAVCEGEQKPRAAAKGGNRGNANGSGKGVCRGRPGQPSVRGDKNPAQLRKAGTEAMQMAQEGTKRGGGLGARLGGRGQCSHRVGPEKFETTDAVEGGGGRRRSANPVGEGGGASTAYLSNHDRKKVKQRPPTGAGQTPVDRVLDQ